MLIPPNSGNPSRRGKPAKRGWTEAQRRLYFSAEDLVATPSDCRAGEPPCHPRHCVLCGRPANRGVRCQVCRDKARHQRFIQTHVAPYATPVQYQSYTQEELDEVPF